MHVQNVIMHTLMQLGQCKNNPMSCHNKPWTNHNTDLKALSSTHDYIE